MKILFFWAIIILAVSGIIIQSPSPDPKQLTDSYVIQHTLKRNHNLDVLTGIHKAGIIDIMIIGDYTVEQICEYVVGLTEYQVSVTIKHNRKVNCIE